MRTTKKLVKVGHSLGIIIDKSIAEKLELSKGDFIELNIKKLK